VGYVRRILGKDPGEVSFQDVQALIDNSVPEGANLEYKGAAILGTPEKLSEWTSAFLNAEGGLLIVGVSEDDERKKERISAIIYPGRLNPAEPTFTRERVEQLVYDHVHCDVRPTIQIHAIPVDEQGRAVYLIDVPEGDNPPYQAADGRYYKRLNCTKYPMRHREIADFLGRRRRPCLHLHAQVVEFEKLEQVWRFTVRLFLSNDGRAAARYLRFSASFGNAEIIAVPHGDASRIDELRRGVPSLQWDKNEGVVHAAAGRRSRFADVQLAQQDPSRPVTMRWNLTAEDFEVLQDTIEFDDEFFQRLRPGERPYLPPQGRHPKD
jgi:hypothetical protein